MDLKQENKVQLKLGERFASAHRNAGDAECGPAAGVELCASDVQSIVAAWQAGTISRDTGTDLFRRGEVLPEGRSVEEEAKLIAGERPAPSGNNAVARASAAM